MLLFLDKPVWPTSFDLVKKVKRIRRWEKVWHSWTLDPLASWLMILWIWKSTKRLHGLTGLDKSYTACIDLMQWSDTRDSDAWEWKQSYPLDSNNQKIATKRWRDGLQTTQPPKKPGYDQIVTFCKSLRDRDQLPLAPFSAKKHKWKKLYEYARAWNPLMKSSPMSIIDITVLSYAFPILKIDVRVWSWTYIRSIAQTVWNHFWLGWIITELRRTSIWNYSVNQLK